MRIYQKIQQIQNEVKEIIRSEKNKSQGYFFFNELQIMRILKPLLKEQKLIILISDDPSYPINYTNSNEGKLQHVCYLKKIQIIDTEFDNNDKNGNSQKEEYCLNFNFWACGSNFDTSKAKGASDTYSLKYALSKLFLIPVKDETDPDY